MRCLIDVSQEAEVIERMNYLYEVFKVYTLPRHVRGEFITLDSIPLYDPDILIFVGHDSKVKRYIEKFHETICEKYIVLITCQAESIALKLPDDKIVFVSYQDDDASRKRRGSDYGFKFDITDSELDLYNSSGTFVERLSKSFKEILRT